MFMQPLSKHHICHQQLPSHETYNHENLGGPMSDPSLSSVCSSQCTDSCENLSLSSSSSSSSLPVTMKEHTANKQTQFKCEQKQRQRKISNRLISNYYANDLATTAEARRVRFNDSSTSSEPSSLSLLFEQSTHNSDPLGSNHVM